MTTGYQLTLTLLSDTTFGRGDGVAGLVDVEVQHDDYGLPYLGGKTLKGMLMAECAEILAALERAKPTTAIAMQASAARLFGDPGSEWESGRLHVGDAHLPDDLRSAIAAEFALLPQPERGQRRHAVLESLTALRRQTAMSAVTGAPQKETLRTMRVIVRETPFAAQLDFLAPLEANDGALLAACVKAFRRAGTGRHRGRGRLRAELMDATGQTVTEQLFSEFERVVNA